MTMSVLFEDWLEIPRGIDSLGEFRVWAWSPEFPEKGRIDYLHGRIEVDMSPEDLFCHGSPKTELVIVLGGRIRRLKLGHVFTDGTRISSPIADLSVEPDLIFVSHQSLATGRVRLLPRASGEGRFIEMEGGADLIAEIVSDSSEAKDKHRLPPAYFAAGVGEYWLIDARKRALLFQIYRRGRRAFLPVKPDRDGFQASAVMQCAYRLDREKDTQGHWTYELREREP